MTEQSADLLSKIDEFLSDTGMGESYFGKCAVGNSELVGRLRNGGQVFLNTAARVDKFIKDERERRKVLNVPERASAGEAAL